MEVGLDATAGLAPSTVSNRAQLSREDFLKILVEELSQQDPMKPMDNAEFLGQLVSLGNLEAISDMSTKFGDLIFQSQMGSASGILGKQVTGVDERGDVVTGIAERLEVDGKDLVLDVQGRRVNFTKVLEVSEPPVPAA